MRINRLFDGIPLFSKLLAVFLLVIGPLYVIGLLMYHAGATSVKREISQSLSTQVKYYMSSIDGEIQRMNYALRKYATDPDIQKLSVGWGILSYFDRTVSINNLQRSLVHTKNTIPFIEDVFVYFPEISREVTANHGYGPLSDEHLQLFTLPLRGVEFVVYQQQIYLPFSYPEYSQGEDEQSYIICIVISQSGLASALNQFANNMGGSAELAGEGWFIASDQRLDQLQEIVAQSNLANTDERESNVSRAVANGTDYLVTVQRSDALNGSLVLVLPEDRVLGSLRQYHLWLIVLSLTSVIIIILFGFSIYRQIHQPLINLVKAFRKVEKGNLETIIHIRTHDEFNYLYGQFNSMVHKLSSTLLELVEARTKAQRSELKQLQSQINPHFLYNSFFILHGLAKLNDNSTVIRLSKKLGQYFHYLTRSGMDTVQLGVEVKFARAYVEIQTIRFAKRIQVSFAELPAYAEGLVVPRLVLQPIIENAYKHGLENRSEGGKLDVTFFTDEQGRFVIAVEDNGEGPVQEVVQRYRRQMQFPESEMEMTGMFNVNRRISLMFGAESGLSVAVGDQGGLRVELTFAWDGKLGQDEPSSDHER